MMTFNRRSRLGVMRFVPAGVRWLAPPKRRLDQATRFHVPSQASGKPGKGLVRAVVVREDLHSGARCSRPLVRPEPSGRGDVRDAVELGRCLPVLFLGLIVGSTAALGDEPATDVRIPPPFETFLVIPLRVHVLSAPDLPEIDCKLRDEDVTRIVGKINGVWKMAGLHWGLDAIVREPAARQEKFKLARALGRGANLGIYRLLAPDESRDFDGLHVYYIHEFAVNGVWLGAAAFVQETAELREVRGGIDEPIPRVTAHELGHALGLSHRQDRTNLLASGTTGTLINTREVESVRKTAKALAGVKTVAELKAEAALAEKSGDPPRARIFWTWLAEIPGADGEPKAALERLRVEDGDKGVTFFDGIQGGFYIE